MSEYYPDELGQDAGSNGETEPAVDVAKLQKALEKANKEALEARLELRRSQLETEYGKELVDLIPSGLPQTEWKDYAEKLQQFRGQPQASETQAGEPEAPAAEAEIEPPTPEEQQLATATGGPATGTTGAGDADAARERIIELAKQATI